MKIKTRQKYHKISHKGADDYGIFGMRAIKNGDKLIYYTLYPGEEQFGIVYKEHEEERFNSFIKGTRQFKLKKLLK